jgi:hypothetical protein
MTHRRENPHGPAVGSFYDRMTSEQRAELDEGIAQAERGQVRLAEEVFDRLAKRFGFARRLTACHVVSSQGRYSPRHGLRRPSRMCTIHASPASIVQ